MRCFRFLLLALLLAAAPLLSAAGDASAAQAAASDAAGHSHGDPDSPSKDEGCHKAGTDHCSGGPPDQTLCSAASGPFLPAPDNGPESRHPEYDPPPPRA